MTEDAEQSTEATSASRVEAVAAPKSRKSKKKSTVRGTKGKKTLTQAKTSKKKAGARKATVALKQSVGGRVAGKTRALVVVESPAKAKTIKKYLGSGYTVKASVGHVKDLPKSKLSVDIDNGFQPHYEVIRGKSKVIKEIKDAAKNADVIYLAPDPDREGEAIAWHIAEELGRRHQPNIHRIAFNEITKDAVNHAIAHPEPLNQYKYESQQARRILDRIVGYQISPILWDKVRRGLSAGRVQSVAVRLLVEREKAIKAFVAEEFWTVDCSLKATLPPGFVARVIKDGEEKFRPTTEQAALLAKQKLETAAFQVASVVRRERRRKPLAPLITSKLQQEAANRLRFTAKRTMMVAQQLYEGVELGDEGSVALITYMRTDSTRIAQSALDAVREHIQHQFGPQYLPEAPVVYKSKKNAQDAHEAIRPTSMAYPPERIKPYVTAEQHKLYTLIWRAFIACQMLPAVYDQTTVDIQAAGYTLRATGSIIKFDGFLAAHADQEDAESTEEHAEERHSSKSSDLPELEAQMPLEAEHIVPEQHFTQPPPRFSESSLVRELEEQGIGRPSTYATILSTIVTRGYVSKQEGRFYPTELGSLITELLVESFPDVLDVQFTAEMEDNLDAIETGNANWVGILTTFYTKGFREALERAKTHMRDVKREEIPTEHHCSECGQIMNIRWGRNGSFLACAGYPKCRNTRDYERTIDGEIVLVPEQTTDKRCPTCKGPMVVKRGRFGQFLACEAYPECKGTRPVSIGVDCPNQCGGYIAERRSKRGRIFYGCSEYPVCTFAAWDRPVPGPCPECAHPYLVRKYSKRDGVTIKCPNKECSYSRDPELDDADAQAVSAAAE